MATLWKDLAHGARLFAVQPGYALAATITLALAIGANTLIFTMANVLVLKPLPVRDPDRLGWIFAKSPDDAQWRGPISLPEYVTFRDGAPAFERLSASRRQSLTMHDGVSAERILGAVVVGNLHELWGLRAHRGRVLSMADERQGAAPVAVLSHRFWIARFGGAPDAVGRDIRINGEHRTIVGVLTPDIELGNQSEIDLWLPYQGEPSLAPRVDRSWRALGRLADGATIDAAHAQVAALAARMVAEHPETDVGRSARVGPTRDALGAADTWAVLALLVTVVGLLLLLACANVMNLLIARLIGRRSELAVRLALGATRTRVVRQVVGESLVIGLAGGALGLAIAWGGLEVVRAVAYEPFFRQLTIDGRVLAFAGVLAFVAPVVFSVLPTLRMLRVDVRDALNEATTRSVGGRNAARGQSALVVVQVSLAVTLLVVAGLVVKSVRAITRADVGYPVSGLLSANIEIPTWKVEDDRDAYAMRQAIIGRALEIAGVRSVATTTELPALQMADTTTFVIGSRVVEKPEDRPTAAVSVTSPAFFTAMQIPIVAGRGFTEQDTASPAPVVVISETAARRYFGGAPAALGAQITPDPPAGDRRVPMTIVGVSADVANPDLDQAPRPHLFVLDAHRLVRSFYLVARAENAGGLAPALRAAVTAVDADIPTYQLRTVEEAFADEFSSSHLLSGLFAAFAIVAVLLATAGLYGVMAYTVSQRAREIAVRIALGASAREVATAVAGRSLRLTVVGGVVGLVGAFGLAQAMRSILYGVGPTDAMTYMTVIAIAATAAMVAAWVPMRRAARVDPVQGLRQ
jgi:predicted permease